MFHRAGCHRAQHRRRSGWRCGWCWCSLNLGALAGTQAATRTDG